MVMRGLSEIVPIQDTVISGLGAIERLGGNMYRFWFYIEQTSDDGEMEKIVVSKLIAPASVIPDAVMKTIAAITEVGGPMLVPSIADMVN